MSKIDSNQLEETKIETKQLIGNAGLASVLLKHCLKQKYL